MLKQEKVAVPLNLIKDHHADSTERFESQHSAKTKMLQDNCVRGEGDGAKRNCSYLCGCIAGCIYKDNKVYQ